MFAQPFAAEVDRTPIVIDPFVTGMPVTEYFT